MSENIAVLTINKPTELLKQYIGRSCSVIVWFCVMMDKRELYKTFYTAWWKDFPDNNKKDDVQKECNAAWDQLKKNNPDRSNEKKIEGLRRNKMKQKIIFSNA